MAARKKQKEYIFAVGRRKTCVARVRLYKGKDQHTVNSMPIDQYFPGEQLQKLWSKPFQLTQTEGKYFITVKTAGGGKKGQLDATVHGLARALALLNEEAFKPLMRKNGLLTRDPRARERRKVGTGGKARRAKQSPKR
ncbi:MAG: 30S ribosomal protein S9 [Candidatus Blackburnbacteria bacterium]|nr:30S ribosomal protein S9 [Candidatus Blackburnbacteria bacterium]